MEDKICHIFHHGLTIYIKKYLPYPEGDRKRLTNHFFKKKSKVIIHLACINSNITCAKIKFQLVENGYSHLLQIFFWNVSISHR